MFDFVSFNIYLWLIGFAVLFGGAALFNNPIPVIGGIIAAILTLVALIKAVLIAQDLFTQRGQIAYKKDKGYYIKGSGHPVKVVKYGIGTYWFYDPVDKKFISPASFASGLDHPYGENDVEDRYLMFNCNMYSCSIMNDYLKDRKLYDTKHIFELFTDADRWAGRTYYSESDAVPYRLGVALAKATLGPVFDYHKLEHDEGWRNSWYVPDMEKAIRKRTEARKEITDILRRYDKLLDKYPLFDETYYNKLVGCTRIRTENKESENE